jgi:prevent-host-death family protein
MHSENLTMGAVYRAYREIFHFDVNSVVEYGQEQMTNMPASAKHQGESSNSARSVSVAQAKANFSALVKGVEMKQMPITILRRGVPVAQVAPLPAASRPLLRGSMAGKGRELGNIVSPYLEEWTVAAWPEPASEAKDD